MAGWITILVVAIVRWSDVQRSLRPGLIVAAAVLALSLPGFVFSVVFLDMSAMLPPALKSVAPYLGWLTLVMGFVFMLIGVAHTVLQVGLSDLAVPDRSAFPFLSRAAGAFGGWGWAALIGVAGGFGSTFLFHVMGVKAGSAVEMMQKMFPGIESYSPIVVMVAFLPAFLAAAVGEEVLYRGVLQGWLARGLGNGTAGLAVAIVVSSVLWALAHAANASPMLPKLMQVVLLGFAFGAIARRWSVEASIVAHACLNVSAVAGAMILTGLGKA